MSQMVTNIQIQAIPNLHPLRSLRLEFTISEFEPIQAKEIEPYTCAIRQSLDGPLKGVPHIIDSIVNLYREDHTKIQGWTFLTDLDSISNWDHLSVNITYQASHVYLNLFYEGDKRLYLHPFHIRIFQKKLYVKFEIEHYL